MHTNEAGTLEQALDAIEREAEGALRNLSAALKEAKRVKTAAAQGQLRDLRAALDALVRLSETAAGHTAELRGNWQFDEQQHFASGAYLKELLQLAREQSVQIFESDERLLCYPAIVAVSPSDTSVVIDKAKERRVRPSFVVRTLKALQASPPKFKAEAFLESLAVAYDLATAKAAIRPGATIRLIDIYGVFTVMPGSARDYTKAEFARDLYLLDESGLTRTRNGRVLGLPASALTRGTPLVTVTKSGNEKVYAGICFEDGA